MDEFKGTPGPWRISTTFSPYFEITTSKNGVIEGSKKISSVENSFKPISEVEANANLISAAPDMLNALKASRKIMQKNGINYDNVDIYNLIDKAIRKALGGK